MGTITGSPDLAFRQTFTALRHRRQLSQKDLAFRMGVDPSYISHVEHGRHRPTPEFARRAEDALAADGALTEAFGQYWREVHGPDSTPPAPAPVASGSEVIIESEQSTVTLGADGVYQIVIVRHLRNTGQRPLTRFPTRIEPDICPDDPDRSRSFYTGNPVEISRAGFWATLDGEPAPWTTVRDRPAYKRLDILFAPAGSPQPVYPGDTAVVACGWSLHWTQWGDWLARAVRWPTRHLSITLAFPAADVTVTGQESTWSEDRLLRTSTADGAANVHTWQTSGPALGGIYQFAWRLAPAAPAAGRAPDLPARDQVHAPTPPVVGGVS
ncbi:helix-turn-helix domain-containing protein [Actinoplanes sp. CA-030573]|uniref:helix-turn-helix domain-containing protein n=1 Tax=Actinoplanes sp. CA-030573 TaxID=3239898 RepID=UPI003D8E9530